MDYDFIHIDMESVADPLSTTHFSYLKEVQSVMLNHMKELTSIQKRRIYMKYYINMKNVYIAKIENVSEGAIRKSIKQSISYLRRKMYKYIH